ncbi:hypothetical protein SO802_018505 [Lithocarpus litseifolius]|uniref:Uncharacterized protein n=1 Tax=Lithocarpus litseifolius TaxID=425828 RepID=A0AAW2CMW8_9ROSI
MTTRNKVYVVDLHSAAEAAAHASQELPPPHWSSTLSFKLAKGCHTNWSSDC